MFLEYFFLKAWFMAVIDDAKNKNPARKRDFLYHVRDSNP